MAEGVSAVKALTLKQPWASLFVAGSKRIETRSWGTKHRGPVAVHASAKISREDALLCLQQSFATALAALGFNTPADLPVGAILGTVEIVNCLLMFNRMIEVREECVIRLGSDPRLTETERAFGHYEHGRFAWITSPGRLILNKPIPARGMLGLWELPGEIAASLP